VPKAKSTKSSGNTKTYTDKRSFDKTPEPKGAKSFDGNVDIATATPGGTFMIHQHHARRLHYDLRLEFLNGKTPVLVSWAVPKNLPKKSGKPHLAVHVEDHPFEYGKFSGPIPAGNYGAGEVRIFDAGTFEVLEQAPRKLTIKLQGKRQQGVWHLVHTSADEGKDDWLVFLKENLRPEPDPLPELVPMLATLERDAFSDDRWLFEPKWDGVRALATCMDETLLVSRTGRNITATYPEIGKLHDHVVGLDAVLDGEIVAITDGRPSFERLQSRMNVQNARDIARLQKTIPVTYMAFDLLYLDGKSLLNEPVEKRKDLLAEIVVPSDFVQVSSYIEGEGEALFEAACEQNLEGIVAKKLGSSYRPGKRSRDWLKIKTTHEADLVVGGWSKGEGNRSKSFGALLVGAFDDDGVLHFVGSVGTGFSERTLDKIYPQLEDRQIDECPFASDPTGKKTSMFGKPLREPRWTKPELVARVEFRELTSQLKLRAPSFKELVSGEPCTVAQLKELAWGSDGE
jgi:bifunctional non-homologous end joining protein LigD